MAKKYYKVSYTETLTSIIEAESENEARDKAEKRLWDTLSPILERWSDIDRERIEIEEYESP